VPFVRFSRDTRGYEHIYLIDASTRGGRASRARVLYWFRTPPGVKVGRKPFDEEVRRTLEKQNPHLVFDWKAIVSTAPPPEPEPWRERRRLERLAKQARLAAPDETESVTVPQPVAAPPPGGEAEAARPGAAGPGSGGRRKRRRGRRRRGGGQQAEASGPQAQADGPAISAAVATGAEDPGSEPPDPSEPPDRSPDTSYEEE